MRHRRVTFATRALALAMALVVVQTSHSAHAGPGDIFSVPAPAVGSAAPKAADINAGDASVSTQTGALQYSFPIAVPPGRHGMQPHLSLDYSSQAPIYGSVAAGWSLAIPIITLDTTQGRMAGLGSSPPAKIYKSSMAGNRPLVQVTEPATPVGVSQWRAQNDATFTRYELMSYPGTTPAYWWRALSTDGSTYFFGQRDSVHMGSCNFTDEYAPLTQVVDSFGNYVDYQYTSLVASECVISKITWGANAAAGMSAFAGVTFSYNTSASALGTCSPGAANPIGSQASYRTGTAIVTGASELDAITVTAYPPGNESAPVHTRVVTLGYDTTNAGSCTASHAAYRALTSIQESAWGSDSPRVDLPAVTFSYGSASFGSGALAWSTPSQTTLPWSTTLNGDTRANYNLGWGYRFNNTSNRWPTVESMFLDVDGDGLPDRVSNDGQVVNGVLQCGAAWERNLGNFTFGAKQHVAMPTIKWQTTSGSDPYAGGAGAVGEEGCSLNYQLTNYTNQTNSNVCAANNGNCPTCSNGTDCKTTSMESGATYLAYRWFDVNGDGLPDLVASVANGGLYNLQQGTASGAPFEPALLGVFPQCPSASTSADSGAGQYTMCGGMYPWFVYLNHGMPHVGQSRPVFGVTPQFGPASIWPDYILYQPIALETSTGDSSISGTPIGSSQGAIDVDGDGFPDGVWGTGASSSYYWNVYRNSSVSGRGQLVARSDNSAYPFFTGNGDKIQSWTFPNPANPTQPLSREGFLDLNGDGLPDHWSGSNAPVQVEYNDGASTCCNLGSTTINARPGTDGVSNIDSQTVGGFVIEGTRQDSSRTYDVDLDGRVDLVQAGSQAWPPALSTYFNQNAGFGNSPGLVADSAGALHTIVVTDKSLFPNYAGPMTTSATPFSRWEISSDMMDLDGDGIPEGIDFRSSDLSGNPGTMYMSRIAQPTSPPRLLATINNGRGAITTVTYGSTTNTNVVGQRPDLGKRMPQTQWVVQSLSTADSLAGTTTATSYFYYEPEYRLDPTLNNYAFRGFDYVTATLPTGASRVDVYDYRDDFSGRHVSTQISPAAGEQTVANEVRSVEDTKWLPFTLFNGALTTFHAVQVDHWTCKNGQDAPTCRTSVNDDTHTRTVATVSPQASPGTPNTPWLYKETVSWLQTGASADSSPPALSDGDRITTSTFYLAGDSTNYRLLPWVVTKAVWSGGTAVLFAKVAHTLDSTSTVALSDEVWVDTVDAHRSITTRTYDMQTGNVLTRQKPAQNLSAWQGTQTGSVASYTYDSRKLFVVTETSEPNKSNTSLVRSFNYEYGTGTKLETQGPNALPCYYTVQGCPTGTIPREDHRVRVDGLGRPFERHETFMNYGGSNYLDVIVELNSFVDGPAASVTRQSGIDGALDGNPVRYRKELTTLDGHGRPLQKTVYALGAAAANAITTYTWRSDGTLQSVTVPDPSQNSTATVTYTYGFDSLGRPTSMRRPDDPSPTNQSGVNLSYNGLVTTSSEVALAPAQTAVTQTTKDAFGRVTLVQEQTATGPTWASTVYAYGADDNITTITDPEGNATMLTHDFAGRRTSITRNSRTWSYAYDANGNMYKVTVPGALGVLDAPNYVTTIIYDDLDRSTSKLIGPRAMLGTDVAYFGADHETFVYDNGSNDSGRLYSWASYGSPNASAPTTFSAPNYNAQGQQMETYHYTGGLAGSPALQRIVNRNYRIDGSMGGVYLFDAVGAGTNAAYAEQHADARGLPFYLYVDPTGTGPQYFSVLDNRNVAGLVTQQVPYGGLTGSQPTIESDWTYDSLGRVTSQKVLQNSGTSTAARQDLTYFGNDDVQQLDQYLGTSHKIFQYAFDQRHQVTSASETSTRGYYSATYTFGTAGRFTSANVQQTLIPPPANSEVKTRNVTYQYATGTNSDPEEVAALITPGTPSTTYASFAYDAVGNQTMRCVGGAIVNGACGGTAETDYVYDGKDQLRRATAKAGGVTQGSEEYWYDGNGKRMIAVKRDGGGTLTEMIWWIDEVEAHYDATFNVAHVLSYLSLGSAVVRLDRTADTTINVEYLYHGLGNSTLAAVDQVTGTINASMSYGPFGEIVEATDSGTSEGLAAHRRHFNDKYVDAVSDLAYYGARYYDKLTMTWTQGDPLYRLVPDLSKGTPRRADLYAYSLNNALRYFDPDGLDARCPNGSCDRAVSVAMQKENRNAEALGRFSDWGLADSFLSVTGSLESVPTTCIGPPGDCNSTHTADATSRSFAMLNIIDLRMSGLVGMPVVLAEHRVGDGVGSFVMNAACAKDADVCRAIGLVLGATVYRPFSWHDVEISAWAIFGATTLGGIVGRLGLGAGAADVAANATLAEAVGDAGAATVRSVLKGRLPLSALTTAERNAAAQFYRQTAEGVGGRYAAEAAAYNVARAEYLEGTRAGLSPTLPQFIANGF
jgi:RHS repeat-associated protein